VEPNATRAQVNNDLTVREDEKLSMIALQKNSLRI
jgi:hypothetical protein